MEPRIQYAQTEDGVSIAHYSLGQGMPFVVMPNIPFGHVQLEWQIPEYREWYQRVARTRRLVRYDSRGQGLSDRDVMEYSIDAWRLDLEAAMDHLGLKSFALFAPLHTGPVAIDYAARYPERVSHLLLWMSYARNSDYLRSPQLQTLRALMGQDWELYTETVAHAVLGWAAGQAGDAPHPPFGQKESLASRAWPRAYGIRHQRGQACRAGEPEKTREPHPQVVKLCPPL